MGRVKEFPKAFKIDVVYSHMSASTVCVTYHMANQLLLVMPVAWMRQKPMTIKRPPLLRPLPQLIIIPTLASETPAQKPHSCLPGRLNGRIGSAHETLSQILKTVSGMPSSIETEVEIFAAGRGRVIRSSESVQAMELMESAYDGQVGAGEGIAVNVA